MNWVNEDLLVSAGVDASTGRSIGDTLAVFTIQGGDPAVEIWKRLAKEPSQLGGWPVLCGAACEFAWVEKRLSREPAGLVQDILASVPPGSPAAAHAAEVCSQREEVLKFFKEEFPASYDGVKAMYANAEATSEKRLRSEVADITLWPDKPTAVQLRPYTALDFYHGPNPLVALGICRTQYPFEVPAFLRFGSRNKCPSPGVHVAYLRDWHTRFGALPFGFTIDVMELYLPQPLTEKEVALSIAREQYEYCPEIVEQGMIYERQERWYVSLNQPTRSVESLAKEIWGSEYWHFAWD
jgi:hypothetical protein